MGAKYRTRNTGTLVVLQLASLVNNRFEGSLESRDFIISICSKLPAGTAALLCADISASPRMQDCI
jgi:hypothetical protein